MALDAMHGAEKQRARVAGQRATKAGGGVRRRSCRRCGLRRLVIRKEVLAAASIGSIRVPAPKTPHQRKIGGAASVLALLAVVSRRISGREEGGGGGGRRAGFLRRADARHRVSRAVGRNRERCEGGSRDGAARVATRVELEAEAERAYQFNTVKSCQTALSLSSNHVEPPCRAFDVKLKAV